MATIPKSSGVRIRDNTAVITNEIIIPAYLDTPVYMTPDINFFFSVMGVLSF
jgi:hypothetical protein